MEFAVGSGSDFSVSDGSLKCAVAGIYLVSSISSWKSSNSSKPSANIAFNGKSELNISQEIGGATEFIAEMAVGNTLGIHVGGALGSLDVAVSLVRIK